jgi:hypothetical protein
MHWVQLKTAMTVEVRGEPVQKYPGDWVEVGRQTATDWIARGLAWSTKLGDVMPPGCGIVARGGKPQDDCLGLPVKSRAAGLPYPRTLLWDAGGLNLRSNILPVGFRLLDNWQVVAPLFDYDVLACHVGSEGDRERAKAVVRDLRVPIYDVRMLFFRRCRATLDLLALWRERKKEITEPKLSFLAALYEVKPVVCAQPTSWTRKA